MGKYLPLAALLLTGCTAAGQPRVGAIVGVIAGIAVLSSTSSDDDDAPETGQQCTTTIGPGPGIGSQSTTCR